MCLEVTLISRNYQQKRYNIRMGFQDSLNEVRKKERMTEGSERERVRERENKSDLKNIDQ